jgi:hypothetical protein
MRTETLPEPGLGLTTAVMVTGTSNGVGGRAGAGVDGTGVVVAGGVVAGLVAPVQAASGSTMANPTATQPLPTRRPTYRSFRRPVSEGR